MQHILGIPVLITNVHLHVQGQRESDVVCVQLALVKTVDSVHHVRICQNLVVQVVRSSVVN